MGTAMHFAMDDIRHIVGMHSDTEEHAEDDGEYNTMSKYINKKRGLKRSDSDKSTLSRNAEGSQVFHSTTRGEKLLQVSILVRLH